MASHFDKISNIFTTAIYNNIIKLFVKSKHQKERKEVMNWLKTYFKTRQEPVSQYGYTQKCV